VSLDPTGHPVRLLLAIPEAAERLSLSRATVQRLVASGVLPSVKVGKARRVALADLVTFVETLQQGSESSSTGSVVTS
jgi:excisionase family DNA binding protein